MVKEEELYGRKKKKIPTPRFVLFYNGTERMPERTEYRLSDLFAKPTERPELELIVTVYNINPGMNEELMDDCKLLKEYMLFVSHVRENRRTMEHNEAVAKAVDECIAEGILREFLLKNKAEADGMSIFEYDEAAHMEVIRREGYEDGLEAGRREGREAGRREGREAGRREGHEAGERKLGELVEVLLDLGRMEDARKVTNDTKLRQALYKEFDISD